ncbi:O-antigen ligase family protein [Shewanella sp. HL-SH5]|uniref:O-antigen ligase family protein n=1 Tax=Shewanella sp. HL-SH5 TaxID=3436241 RepID=UPI003EBA15CC
MKPSLYGSSFFIIALCILLVWVPIPLASNRIWAWSIIEFYIISLSCLHLVFCVVRSQPLFTQHWQKYALLPIGLLLLFTLLQWTGLVTGIDTVDEFQTFQQLIKTLCFCLFIYLLAVHCQSARLLRWVCIAIIVSGCIQAFYGSVLNLLDLPKSPIFGFSDGDRAKGSFVYQNHFANFLALSISIAFGWLISELKTTRSGQFDFRTFMLGVFETLISSKIILRLAIVIMIIGLILSRSRMGNAGFFTALITVALLALVIYRNPPKMLKPLVISIFILDLIIVGSIFGVEKVKQRIEDTSFAAETRDDVVRDSIPIIEQHWLTGNGAGSFYTVFPQYQTVPYSGFYDHAHNDYIQFAVEYGVVITASLGLWIIYCLWLACRTMYLRNNKLYKGIAFGCAMAIVHMLIHCTVDFNLQSPANTLLFLTILTLCWLVRYLPTEQGSRLQKAP